MVTILRQLVAHNIWVATLKAKVTAWPFYNYFWQTTSLCPIPIRGALPGSDRLLLCLLLCPFKFKSIFWESQLSCLFLKQLCVSIIMSYAIIHHTGGSILDRQQVLCDSTLVENGPPTLLASTMTTTLEWGLGILLPLVDPRMWS